MFQSDDEWVDSIQECVYSVMDECESEYEAGWMPKVSVENMIEVCLTSFYQDGEVDYYKAKNPHLSDEEVQNSFRENIRYMMEDR